MRKNKSIKSLLLSYSGKFSSMSYSGLSRVSMDPRNKSEDDKIERVSEDNCYKKNESKDDQRECVFEDDFILKSSLRADRRGQVIYKLEKKSTNKSIVFI